MFLFYNKTIAFAFAILLMTNGALAAGEFVEKLETFKSYSVLDSFYSDVEIKCSGDIGKCENYQPSNLQDKLSQSRFEHKLQESWNKRNTYQPQGTFMDILMKDNSFYGTTLDASNLDETNQFRAILKGICKLNRIKKVDTVWESIEPLNDANASLWLKAILSLRSRDKTFFNSYFNLKELYLNKNKLADVNVRMNTKLEKLDLSNNQITYVDLGNGSLLKFLRLSHNKLTSVDVKKCISLETMFLNDNDLTFVDVRMNTLLKLLRLDNNKLTSVDVSMNTALNNLHIEKNKLKSFNVSMNTMLIELHLNDNELKSMDVRKNTSLKTLDISSNYLTSLNVDSNSLLEVLILDGNELTFVDVSNNSLLKTLYLCRNELKSISVFQNISLEDLHLSSNELTFVDVSNNPLLKTLLLRNNQLTSLDVSGNTVLKSLELAGNESLKRADVKTYITNGVFNMSVSWY